MSKQLKMWLARPVGWSKEDNDFAWMGYVAEDALGAALEAVKYRKTRDSEPRQVYEVVPMKLDQKGFVARFPSKGEKSLTRKPVGGDASFQAMWDWDNKVEVRV